MGQSPSSNFYNEEGKGLPFFQGVTDFSYKYPNETFWTTVAPKKAEINDVLFSVRAPVGDVNIANKKCCIGRGIAAIRSKTNQIDYLLKYESIKIQRLGTGAVYDAIKKSDLENILLNIFEDPNSQFQVGSLLVLYDDLIDTNCRRIQLLEEVARLFFREWFVYFRFPGHEKVKLVDGDGSKIPSDWDYLPFAKIKIFKKAPLGVLVFTDIRQYYQTSEIDGTTITGDGEEVDYENRPSRANIAPAINTVYFAKMKDTNKVLYFNKGNSFLLEKILLSTGMVGFTTDEKYLGFLFSLLKSYEFVQYKNNFATGATQVSLNNASLKKIKVLFPKLNLVELYSEIVNPLLEKCSLLKNQNQKLAQARDLLLPRLMSGEIEV